MKKIIKEASNTVGKWLYSKNKVKSLVGAIIGEDGDLFIAYEGGIPLRARDLLNMWYKYMKKSGDTAWLDRKDKKQAQIIKRRLEKMQIEI